ncbi:MAG: hypothetical protein GXO21_03035 [Aquificae bacterium]|nr:hypothetical protein [Aquificota bacterium]
MIVKRIFSFFIVSMSFFIFSCGTGGGIDEGISSLIEIEKINPTYMEIDLIKKFDDNDDGICDNYLIPLGDIVQITFKSIVLENTNIQPSDINITSYKVRYIPKTRKDIPIEEETFKTTCLIPAGQTRTCEFPLFYKNKKELFYRMGWFDDFDIEIILYGKEVIYDKSISLKGHITARISDIINENESNCRLELE